MLEGTPVLLLREGTQETAGSDARRANLRGAIALAESIRTTLGPRGLDKMLVAPNGDVTVTNDGATILRTIEIDHPSARMLVELAKAQDAECGDGTKTSVILAGELLRKAEELLDEHVHPTLIVEGYRRAAEAALAHLRRIARPVRPSDEALLRRVAMTSMISKGVAAHRDLLAGLAVAAVREVLQGTPDARAFDRKNIQIVKRTGEGLEATELLEGHVLDQARARPDMPPCVYGARIALLEEALELRKPEVNAEIRITGTGQVDRFLEEESHLVGAMVAAIRAAGASVVFVEKAIGEVAAQKLSAAGIYAVAHVPRKDLELIARATGAHLVDRAHELEAADLGAAGCVEERRLGEDRLTFVTGAPGARSVAIVLRGGTPHVLDEAERSLEDALATVGLALTDGRVVTGAGAAATELSLHLGSFALTVGGREQLAIQAFADALDVVPRTLAESAGMDPVDALLDLRRRHAEGQVNAGVDVLRGTVGDLAETAVEPFRVDAQVVEGATDAAAMLLRIDTIVSARRRPPAGGATGPEAR